MAPKAAEAGTSSGSGGGGVISLAFSSSGPFQFAAPSSFDGKRENFEEFSFKLRAYLNLMNPRYQEALKGIDGNLDQ